MQNVLDSIAQVTLFWNGFFAANSSDTMASLTHLSSFGSLRTTGFDNAAFSYSAGKKAICVASLTDVPIVANTTVVNYPGPANNFELTRFITNFARRDSAALSTYLGGPSKVEDTFSIFIKLCILNDAIKASELSRV
jgi:hypothetical protein